MKFDQQVIRKLSRKQHPYRAKMYGSYTFTSSDDISLSARAKLSSIGLWVGGSFEITIRLSRSSSGQSVGTSEASSHI